MKSYTIWFAAAMIAAGSSRGEAASSIECIANGNFETGNFTSWTSLDRPNGTGAWYISTPGAPTPFSAHPTAPNGSGGNFYAVTDQGGPGTHVLSQPFTVPANAASVIVSYQMFVNDADGGPIIDASGLDHTVSVNQHARVDVLTAGAAPFSTLPADVVANLYIGVNPHNNPNPYASYSHDLTAVLVPGTTYQLRFGEVDNSGFLNQGVDNVSVLATVPEPTCAMIAGCLGILFGGRLRSRYRG